MKRDRVDLLAQRRQLLQGLEWQIREQQQLQQAARRRKEDARGCWSNYNETLRKVYKKNNEAARLETENQELGHQHKALKVQCSAQLEDKDLLVRELIKHLKLSVKIKEKHRLTKTHYLKHKAKMQQHRSQSPGKKHRSSSRNVGIPLKEKGLLTQRTHYP